MEGQPSRQSVNKDWGNEQYIRSFLLTCYLQLHSTRIIVKRSNIYTSKQTVQYLNVTACIRIFVHCRNPTHWLLALGISVSQGHLYWFCDITGLSTALVLVSCLQLKNEALAKQKCGGIWLSLAAKFKSNARLARGYSRTIQAPPSCNCLPPNFWCLSCEHPWELVQCNMV